MHNVLQNYELRQSLKRRSISIQILPNATLRILAPRFISKRKIEELIIQKTDWITKKIQHIQKRQIFQKDHENQYLEDGIFYYLGKEYRLKITGGKSNKISYSEEDLNLILKDGSDAKTILEKHFLSNAKTVFYQRLEICHKIFNEVHQCKMPILKVRQKMKTRYGSMSKRSGMSLNSILIHCKIHLIDYVIMHELCHIKHQDHSRNFYNLFSRVTPDWQSKKLELRTFINNNHLL